MSSTTEPAKPARVIPGLPPTAAQAAASKKRRSKKTSALPGVSDLPDTITSSNAALDSLAAVTVQETPVAPPPNGLQLESLPIVTEDELEEEKRLSPVSVIQKRIKAHNKKLQRIATYEAETEKLNPDQQRAVASKPGLELAVKELQELVTVFTAEEAEETKRLERKAAATEKRTEARIAAAVKAHETEEESHLALLLQFLHLRSLFQPDQNGFAPPNVPPVVQNATGQEYAAVMSLFEALANGPLMGGGEDAIARVKRLSVGDEVDITEGVNYARVKRMIADLTAPPAELEDEGQDLGPSHSTSGQPVFGAPSELPTVNGQDRPRLDFSDLQDNGHAPVTGGNGGGFAISFMQASDIHVDPAQATTPEADPFSKAGPAPPVLPTPSMRWADDDGNDAPLPTLSDPVGAPVLESMPVQPQAATTTDTDGFQAANSSRRGRRGGGAGQPGEGGRGRGGNRGGRARGGPRQEGDRPPRDREGGDRPPRDRDAGGERLPRGEGAGRGGFGGGERGAGRGRGERGGRGRGHGRPRGGGGPGASAAAGAPPAAPAA